MLPPESVSSGEPTVASVVAALLRGDVVGLPTETVYGLAADGTNAEAVRKIFALKGRPVDHPLILHLADISWLERFSVDAPEAAYRLGEACWPGPLTLVLKRADVVPWEVTGGLETVALRVPNHPIALEVLRTLGRPLAAPSANRFGEVSPTTRAHVVHDFGDALPLVLEGGACEVGVESTIVDLTGTGPRLLRPGGVTRADIERILNAPLGGNGSDAPRVPGSLEAHYAPRAEFIVLGEEHLDDEVAKARARGKTVGVYAPCAPREFPAAGLHFVPLGDARAAAHDLYATLRGFDEAGCDVIFSIELPEEGLGLAVADRMRRAAVGSHRE